MLSLDRRPVRSLLVTRPVTVRIGRAGWRLIGIHVDRADRGLRLTATPTTR